MHQRWLDFILYGAPILFDKPDDSGGGDDTGSGGGGSGGGTLAAPMLLDPGAFETFRNGVRRHGSLQHWAEQLFQDAKDARDGRRSAEEKVTNLTDELAQERRKRTSGSSLTPEDAQELEKYRELGKLDEIKQSVEKADTLSKKLSAYERREKLDKAARAEGYDPDAVREVLRDAAYDYKVVEEEEENDDGEKVKVTRGMIVLGDDIEERLSAYFKDRYSRIESSLRASDDDGDDDSDDSNNSPPPPPNQSGSKKGGKKGKVKGVSNDYITKRYGTKKKKGDE